WGGIAIMICHVYGELWPYANPRQLGDHAYGAGQHTADAALGYFRADPRRAAAMECRESPTCSTASCTVHYFLRYISCTPRDPARLARRFVPLAPGISWRDALYTGCPAHDVSWTPVDDTDFLRLWDGTRDQSTL